MLLLSLVLRLQTLSSLSIDPAIADPPWPGGAFPPLPWSTWSLRSSTAGFFLGNTSGPNGPGESLREASLGVVGLGWQLGLRNGSNWAVAGGLEARQRAAAKSLKLLAPDTKVFVSAELDCTFSQWSATRALLRNHTLASQVFMTRPNVRLLRSPASTISDELTFAMDNCCHRAHSGSTISGVVFSSSHGTISLLQLL
eukprot:COSAG02_NODE_169_length_31557_cov_25.092473_21_plen_198_part_00